MTKLSLTILLVVAAALTQQRAPLFGSVEGVALAFGTGGPMANAPLRMSSTQSRAGRGEYECRGKKVTVARGSQNRVSLQAIEGSR